MHSQTIAERYATAAPDTPVDIHQAAVNALKAVHCSVPLLEMHTSLKAHLLASAMHFSFLNPVEWARRVKEAGARVAHERAEAAKNMMAGVKTLELA